MNEPLTDLLVARDLKRTFREAGRDLHVLRGIDLSIKQGEMLAILGASGSGKSTLLHLLGGFDRPTYGSVTFHGDDIYRLSSSKLDRYRNTHVGFVFQFYHLLPELSALENVQIAAMITKSKSSRSQRRKRAVYLLERVGLQDRMKHRPNKLSGGERQRVAIARALMNQPDILLADEPTGNLDRETGASVFNLLHELHTEMAGNPSKDGALCKGENISGGRGGNNFRGAMVIVTHDEHIADRADRALTLTDGRLQTS